VAKRFWTVGLALSVLAPVGSAHADILDSRFLDTEIDTLTGWDVAAQPTGMAFAPDGTNRLFVTRKTGEVQILENDVLRETPFAVMQSIFLESECGLLAVAFDPDFVTNHYVYFFVTVSSAEQRIVRYRDEDSVGVDPTVLVSLPTLGRNHDGGALGFGPDGKLYWAVGDLGSYVGHDVDLASPGSKVGRANRDGTLPEDNPFDDGPGPNYDFVWARGFRNPFTMTFQPSTGALWLNVVGTNYEQVFVVSAGDHGGWSGPEYSRAPQFRSPVVSYRTNATDAYSIAANGAVRSGGVATFSTTIEHWLRLGEQVTIAGVTNTSFNGAGFVTSVP
jgi:hypothetical protein